MGKVSQWSKRRVAMVAALAFFVVTVGSVFAPMGTANGGWIYVKEQPVLRISPTPVPNKSGTHVTFAGVGFEPNQELGIRLMMGGVTSDIRHQVKPAPKTNAEGAFSADWRMRREFRLLKPGVHTVSVVNEDGDVIAQAPLVIDKKPKKKKAKKKK